MITINIKEKEPGVFVVEPIGEINTQTCRELEKKVNTVVANAKAIIFELRGVTYISSLGLSVLFKTKQTLEKNKGTILLVNPQPKIKMVFEAVKVLPDYMFASLQEADEYLDSFLDGIQKGKISPRPPKT